MKTNNFHFVAISYFSLLMLSACGGGSSNGSNSGDKGGTAPVAPPVAPATISGSVSGLTGGSTVVLENNGGDKLSLSSNSAFTFAAAIPLNGSFAVKVSKQPVTQRCNITNGTGINVQANITNVAVICGDTMATILHSFAGTAKKDGSGPRGELTLGTDGSLYGVTLEGGAFNKGSVFKMTPSGAVTVLHSFAGGTADGAKPVASLTVGNDGNFYGVTIAGGASEKGTFYRITPNGDHTVLYSFAGAPLDGALPQGTLKLAKDGNFYGTTFEGGTSNKGTVYKITPSGQEKVLHSFAGTPSDGAFPTGSLNQGSDGNFYVVAPGGGASQAGAIVKITPEGNETVLYSFSNDGIDGWGPRGTLVTGRDGNLYGVTSGGGTKREGTFFKITPGGLKTTLYSFAGGTSEGLGPDGTLTIGNDGNFYGMTSGGGPGLNGTIFMMTPAGIHTLLHGFTGRSIGLIDGAYPTGGLTFGADGYLYGMTVLGGTTGNGTIFRY